MKLNEISSIIGNIPSVMKSVVYRFFNLPSIANSKNDKIEG